MELKNEMMVKVTGGSISSSVINAITKAANTIYEFGRQTGSTIRRLISGKYCLVK